MAGKKNEKNIIKMSADANERGHANEGGMSELYQLWSMVFGFTAFIFKYKFGAWFALLFYLMSIANMRLEYKFQQILTSVGVVIVSFISVYVTPNRASPIAQKVAQAVQGDDL